jgi:asparagine synthase (glutamine-hydrolysing)
MHDPWSGNVITFNGEIYNYIELRDRLSGLGHSVQSSGDTAVILRSLGVDGLDSIKRFRGMFALAFWKARDRSLTLARDPLGIKPLYVATIERESGKSVLFASEVRALLASGLLNDRRLNPRALQSVLWNGFVVSPETIVSGIETLWPGELRVFDINGTQVSSQSLWQIPSGSAEPSVNEAEFASALQNSVAAHMVSDVPVVIFLSGGVDSSCIANLARFSSQAPVHTFTLAFEEAEFNEGPLAKQISDALGTQHHEVVLTEATFLAQLEAALASLDQPSFDGVNTFCIARAVREAGFKVALAGTGGDELFGGYRSFADVPRLMRLSSLTGGLPTRFFDPIAHTALRLMLPKRGAVPPQTRWAKLPAMLRHRQDLLALYQISYALFLEDIQMQLLSGQGTADLGLPTAMQKRLREEIDPLIGEPLKAISALEQRMFLGERLLRDTDSVSMASSLEIRVPLVDTLLIESVSRIPTSKRYFPLGKKSILRRAGLNGLPTELFDRPKSGFVLPYNRWLRSRMVARMDAALRDHKLLLLVGLNPRVVGSIWQAFLDGAPGLYWSRVWALYVLVRWCDTHKVYA